MKNKKEYCENLYEEYKELKNKIDYAFELRDYHSDKKMDERPLPKKTDMKRLVEAKKELQEKCKLCLNLSPEEWLEIKK